ncbi:MAG: MMPL family transporter [Eubacterium ramulus]
MLKFGKGVVKSRIIIFIAAILLLIPSVLGYLHTRVNYDILSYLPEDIETMKGQDILVDEFGTGAFSTFVVDGMSNKEISALKAKIEDVDHVKTVLWYDSVADISIPTDMLPEKMQKVFLSDEGTLMFIMYDTTMSADETMEAVEQIRAISNEQCFLSGMSAVVTDIRDLSDKEVPVYVLLAVILSLVVLSLTMDSFLIPIFFLLSIGMAIIYNLGTNVFMGEISYVTKALSAVLQLGVTMDYSIFLWHSYERSEENIMRRTIKMLWHMRFHRPLLLLWEVPSRRLPDLLLVFHEFHTGYGSGNRYGKRCCIRCDRMCNNPAVHDSDF